MKLATIKLHIDAEAFESESKEPLTDEMLGWLGMLVNEQVACIYGYEGFEAGWVSCPTT